jgi:hypothetical protein
LLWDYVRAGILNGRDPSPYFNTILYLREHDIPPERALLHFLRSGKEIACGAYSDEKVLVVAQDAFRGQTETILHADHRASPQPFAVFLQCGAQSLWAGWQPDPNPAWHMLINHFDATHAGKIPCDVEFQQTGSLPGTKLTSFYSILEKYPQILERYAYILLLDDDIRLENGEISRLFSMVHQHEWEMAQASLSTDSHGSFPVFFHSQRSGWRSVNGVEIMMPVFSTRILDAIKELIAQSISGWGFDAALSVLAARHGYRAAVVDEVIAWHLKAVNADIGAYYQMLHQAQIYPEIEFTHLQKKFGFTKPLFYEV